MLGFDAASQQERGARFAGNWIFGAGSNSSQRRRLMSVLRMAHRVLGIDRKNLGIGSLGFGGRARPALLSSASSAGMIGGLGAIAALGLPTPAFADPVELGGGTATNSSDIAIGTNSEASGYENTSGATVPSIAIGWGAQALGMGANALGQQASATATGTMAVGNSAQASATGASVFGRQTVGSALNATAVGSFAQATGVSATAVGVNTQAVGVSALALGDGAVAGADSAVAVGRGANAAQAGAMSLGSAAFANGTNSIAIGTDAVTNGISGAADAIAIGTGASSNAIGSVAVGANSIALNNSATALGNGANAANLETTAIGGGASATSTQASAIGFNAAATGFQTTALGAGSAASGNSTIALGYNADASNYAGVALGLDSVTDGNSSIAIGRAATSHGLESVAAGANSLAELGGTAVGGGSSATGASSTALGNLATATGASGTAVGDRASATADTAIAIGSEADASATNALAMGTGATADAMDAIAIGSESHATGGEAVSIGHGGTAMGNGAVTLGGGNANLAEGSGVLAMGNGNQAGRLPQNTLADPTTGAVALGSGNFAGDAVVPPLNWFASPGHGAVAIGQDNTATGTGSIALGVGSSARIVSTTLVTDERQFGTIALGYNTTARNGGIAVGSLANAVQGNVAIGVNANASVFGGGAVAIGRNADGDSDAVAVGANTQGGSRSVSIGAGAQADAASIPTGPGTSQSTSQSIAIGNNASANMTELGDTGSMIALGNNAEVSRSAGIALGENANTAAAQGLAVGVRASVSGENATAVGVDSVASGENALAFGNGAQATGTNSISVGTGNVVSGTGSGAFGDPNTVSGSGSYAFGNNNTIAYDNSFVLGNGVTTTQGNSVVLGNASTDREATAETGVTLDGTTYAFAGVGSAADGVVSVGAAGAERQVINVAAGRIAADSTDAVNGSQLFATNQAVEVAAATANMGWNVQANGDTATNVAPGDTVQFVDGQNIEVTRSGTDITIATSADLVADSVTLASGQVFDAAGLDMADTKITNLTDGDVSATSTEAVNGSQLFATNQQVDQNTTDITNLGNRVTTVEGDLADVGDTITDIAGDTSTTYTEANGDGIRYARTNERGLAESDAFAQGVGSTALGYEATATGESALALGRDAQASEAGSVALGSGSTTAAAVATTGTTINGQTYAFAGTAPTSTVSVGAAGAERTVTNVAAGRVSAASTDAINGSQLFATNQAVEAAAATASMGWNVQANGDTATNVAPGDTVQFVDGQNIEVTRSGTDITIATSPDLVADSVTLASGQVLDAAGLDMADTTITNLADGDVSATSTEAVNGSQLFATNQQVDQNTTDITNLGNRVTTVEGDLADVGDTITDIAGDTSTTYTEANGDGIRYARTNERGLAESDAFAQGVGSTALGYEATAAGESALALGRNAQASEAGSVALGSGSTTATAVATTGTTIDGQTYAFAGAAPTSTVSVGAVGAERTVTNVAAGRLSASSTDAVNGSQLFATNQAVEAATATANMGWNVQANGDTATNVAPDDTVQFVDGQNIEVTRSGTDITVATSADLVADSVTLASGQVFDAAGLDMADTKITNLTDGDLSATSSDAVNGSQLYATNQQVATNTTNIAGNTTAITNLGDTITDINNGAGIKYFHANSTEADSQALGTNSVAIGPNAVANNAGDVALGNGSTTSVAVATTGTMIGGVAYGFAGTAPTSTVSVGAAGAERTITNVAAGRLSAASTDAVNGSQLYATNQQVTTNTTDIASLDGRVTTVEGDVTDLGNRMTTVEGDVATISSTITDINNGAGIKYFRANSAEPDAQALGTDSIAIGPNAVANNAGDVALGSGSTTVAAVATTGTTIAGTNYAFAGAVPASTVSVGAVGAERTVTNVAAGRVSAVSTDAINGSQLFATNQAIEGIAGQADDLDERAVKYDWNDANSNGEIDPGEVNYNSATLAGAGGTTITNLADGAVNAASSDAINGSQLHGLGESIVNNLGGSSAVNPDGTITGPTYNIAGNNYTSVYDAISAVDGNLTRYYSVNDAGVQGGNYENDGATGVNSLAVGVGAGAAGAASAAVGEGARATIEGSLALGSGSVSDRALAPASGTILAGTNVIPYNTSDATLLGAVSVGNALTGEYRQITNVADGTEAHDATTIRQLQGAIGSVSATTTKYFHANSTAGDSLAVGQESIAVGPETIVNGDNGIGIGNGALVQQTAPGGTAIGQDAEVSEADAIALGTNSEAHGIQSIAMGAGASAVFANSVALGAGSATGVGAQTGYTGYGLAAPQNSVGEVSIGVAGAERQITNVAAGSAPTDAVNVSQLNQVAQNTADSLGGGASYDPATGEYTGPSYNVGGNTYDNVGDALGAQNTELAEVGDRVTDVEDAVTEIDGRLTTVENNVTNMGDSIAGGLGGNSTYDPATGTITTELNVAGNTYNNVNDAIQAVSDTASAGWNIQADGGPSTNIGSNGTLNVAAGSNTVVTLNGNELEIGVVDNPTFAGMVTAGGGLTVGANTSVDMGGNVVQNVAAGAVNATSTDAVNGSQLYDVQQVANNSVQYDADGNSVTFNPGGDAVAVHNVAAGVAPTDAVNVQQLNDGLAGAVEEANAYTDSRLAGIDYDIRNMRDDANAGIAGALAAAGLPQAFEPGRGMLSFGAGTYQGQSAFAVGLSRVLDDGKTVIKAGATYDTQERAGANVGVGFQF